MELTKPIIHMNGTSAQSLLDAYRAGLDAVRDAQEALSQSRPNGRDYYCHPDPDALKKATAEHNARQAKLQAVYDELMALAEHCVDYV